MKQEVLFWACSLQMPIRHPTKDGQKSLGFRREIWGEVTVLELSVF